MSIKQQSQYYHKIQQDEFADLLNLKEAALANKNKNNQNGHKNVSPINNSNPNSKFKPLNNNGNNSNKVNCCTDNCFNTIECNPNTIKYLHKSYHNQSG